MFTSSNQNPESVLGVAGENVLYLLLIEIMPTIVVGIYIAALLSAVMSTVDSLLVVASSAVTRDFYQKIINPKIDQKSLIKLSKKVTLILAFFALFVAITVSLISPDRTVFWFVIFGWSGIAATFCPVIILALFWKNFSENGAIASMITGFLSVPIFKFLVPKISYLGLYFEKIDVLLPSIILAMLSGYFTSVLKK
jgi:sodium/proline symporter